MAKHSFVPILASEREIRAFSLEQDQQKASVMFFENRLYQLFHAARTHSIWEIYALALKYKQRGYPVVITTDINTYKVWVERQDTLEPALSNKLKMA